MSLPQVLLETLEDLSKYDFEKFKSFLVDGGDFKLMPRSSLEDANRIVTVRKMRESYGEEMAVNIAVGVLKKMNNNNAAEKLKNRYAAPGTTAAPSTSTSAAAPSAAPVAPSAAPVAPPAAPVAPPAAPAAPPAAPASMMAQDRSNIIAPAIAGSTIGTLNINITK